MYCDVLGDTVRPYAPKPLRRVFNSLHGLSHPGIRATQNLVTTRFVWTSINKDHRNWSRQCIPCQRCKDTRQVFSPTETFEALVGHFEHIHIDIVVMQYSQGYRYCLNVYRSFLPLARNNTHSWYGSVNRSFSISFCVDGSFRRTLENNIRPRTPIRIKTIGGIMPVAWHQAFTHDSLSPRLQRDGERASITKSSNQMSRYEQLGRDFINCFLGHPNRH